MKAKITIQNVVAAASINQEVSLDKIVFKFPDVSYRPELFPGLPFKIEKPRSCTLIFRSGKLVCTGTKSVKDAKVAVEQVVETLSSIGVIQKPLQLDFSIQNIVAKVDLGNLIVDIENAAYALHEKGGILYEPEMFPGAIFRMRNPKVVFLIFHQGKLVCVGAKKEEEISEAVEELQKILEESKLILPQIR